MTNGMVHDGAEYSIEQWGNGLCYELRHKPTMLRVFFQGDDAMVFETEFHSMQDAYRDETDEQICARLWYIYDYVATD